MRIRRSIVAVLTVLLGGATVLLAQAEPWPAMPVLAGDDDQELPDIDGTLVVWQEYVAQYGDYDIFIVDINDVNDPLATAIGDANDQTEPAVFGRRVVWQDLVSWEGQADWDIHMVDVTDFEVPIGYVVSQIPFNDEEKPAIHGNVVVWQDTDGADYNIFAADITDPCSPLEFAVAAFEFDQMAPSIHRDTVVWQDNYFGDWDLVGADIWLQDQPSEFAVLLLEADQQAGIVNGDVVVWEDNFSGSWDIYGVRIVDQNAVEEFPVSVDEADQRYPDIDGHLVVWQDDRDGNWDIYGHNLVTGRTFAITTDPGDQIRPAISGNVVVWQDNRDGPWNIFYAVLDGPEAAGCPVSPAGDLDGNCKVDFADMALLAASWLQSQLDAPSRLSATMDTAEPAPRSRQRVTRPAVNRTP